MSDRTARFTLAIGLSLAILASCALALAATRGAQKLELGPELGRPDRLVAYGKSRILLLNSPPGAPQVISRVNADGSLDPSFGRGGHLEIPFSDVVVAPGGKILVAGSGSSPADPSSFDARVTRLLPDGGLDSTFGKGGKADVDLGGRYDGARTLALVAGGKIAIGGAKQTVAWNRGGSDAVPALARLHSDGRLDRSFARGGVRILSNGSEGGVFDVAPAPRGGIMASGEAYIGTVVWKLKASGALDRHFGEKGSVVLEGRGKRLDYEWEETLEAIHRIGVLPSGKVMLAGTGSKYGNGGPYYRVLALRLRTDGRIDRSYGRRGYAMATFGGWTFAHSLTSLPDGRLIVAASAQTPSGKESDIGVVVFRRDGRVDRRFGAGGRLTINLRGWDSAENVITQRKHAVVLGDPGKGDSPWLVRVPLSTRR